MSERYYRASKAAPITGIFTMLTVGTLAAAALGAVYGVVAYFNPLIYFTFLGAAIFGAGVGKSIQYGAKVGRVRNRMFIFSIALLVSALAVYFSWSAYISVFVAQHAPAEVQARIGPVVLDPLVLGSIIYAFAEEGIWSIFGATPTGFVLYGIWAIETLLIGGVAMLTAMSDHIPFCEACQRWTEPQILETTIPLDKAAEFAQAMEAEQYSELNEHREGEINANDCVHLTAHCCPMCEDSNHITAVRISKSFNDKGEDETSEDILFEHMIVPHEVVKGLATKRTVTVAAETADPEITDESPNDEPVFEEQDDLA